MYAKKNCGVQVTPEDYAALLQPDRKRLYELVNEMRRADKLTPEEELRRRAFFQVLVESVPFDT